MKVLSRPGVVEKNTYVWLQIMYGSEVWFQEQFFSKVKTLLGFWP